MIDYINENKIKTVLVRSATTVEKDLIDACPSLEIIGRGGVGMDNIDVDYARSKNIHVINTPSASSESVAELVFAHLFSGARFLQDSNRKMPLFGDSGFAKLKKSYEKRNRASWENHRNCWDGKNRTRSCENCTRFGNESNRSRQQCRKSKHQSEIL